MRALLRRTAILLIPAAAGIGCGDGPGPTPPDPSVLTTVEVIPDTATLFTVTPGTSVELRALAKDQYGETMDDVGPAEFSGEDDAVATVGDDGTVTAAAPGIAVITASMTAGEITESGTATVTVRVAPPVAAVQAPAFAFAPKVVDVRMGGSVTWTIGSIPHDVVFTTPNAPENIQPSQDVSISRTFATQGVFSYHCLIHHGMNGSVRVH